MELTVFIKDFRPVDNIARFMDFYYSLHMTYLASDLLEHGLSPKQISDAVIKAISIGKASGLELNQHFRPVFSGIERQIINAFIICLSIPLKTGLKCWFNSNPEALPILIALITASEICLGDRPCSNRSLAKYVMCRL